MKADAPRPQLSALTSLRFFAALHVVLFHLYALNIFAGTGFYHALAAIGYVGVSFFFILSGFILVYTYADRDFTAWHFWRARFARIYPAYLLSLLFTAPTFILMCAYLPWFKGHWLLSSTLVLTLLQSWVPQAALAWNSPAWSLSVEAFFYLLFPLLLARLARWQIRKLKMMALVCLAVTLSLSIGYVIFMPDGVEYVNDESNDLIWLNVLRFNPLARLPEFIMGACCGFLFLRTSLARKWATPLVAMGALVFLAVAMFSPQISYPLLHNGLLAPAFAAIIYGIALRPGWTAFMEIRPLVLLGDASYSLYLLHPFVLFAYFGPNGVRHQGVLGRMVGFALPIIASVLVYLGIEQPARRKLRGKPKPQPGFATAAARA
jgi:peptidoglycan/LPS O-acetylase OafA/YrhL